MLVFDNKAYKKINLELARTDLELHILHYRQAILSGNSKEMECSNKKMQKAQKYYEQLMSDIEYGNESTSQTNS